MDLDIFVALCFVTAEFTSVCTEFVPELVWRLKWVTQRIYADAIGSIRRSGGYVLPLRWKFFAHNVVARE